MKALSPAWFTESPIDAEHKHYLLMAFLRDMREEFNAVRIYPALAELIDQYRNLIHFKQGKTDLWNQFPSHISGYNAEKQQWIIQKMEGLEPALKEIDLVIEESIPLLKQNIEIGTKLYDDVSETLEFYPVGLIPFYQEEGYLMVNNGSPSVDVFYFHHSKISQTGSNFRMISTQYLTTYTSTLNKSYENLKLELVRNRKELPNPATYALVSKTALPLDSTLLPIAKRKLIEKINWV